MDVTVGGSRIWLLVVLVVTSSATKDTSTPDATTAVNGRTQDGYKYNPTTDGRRPNIVIIMADDMGWNDVSFHGSDQFMTPNIDAMAFSGVILQDYYTQPICSPARAALMTGRHPISNGMQNYVLSAAQPWGLPLCERLMPQYLQDLGYRTYIVGKWHLGFFRSDYTPTKRGFEYHYGLWLAMQDHFTHENLGGFDFRRNFDVLRDAKGKYAADLFTEEAERIIQNHNDTSPLFLYVAHIAPHVPLQAPEETIERYEYINSKKRQKFAAMVTKVDESVGRIFEAMANRNMLENSIIIFVSDNGGATNGFNGNVASNYPLKGGKDTLWEGGVRGVGLVWSPLLRNAPRVHRGLVNVQDWLPTLLTAAGADVPNSNCGCVSALDGVSQWAALDGREPPPYARMLHNIDPVRRIAAMRYRRWKLVFGRTYSGKYDGHYGELTEKIAYDPDSVRLSTVGRAVQSCLGVFPDKNDISYARTNVTVKCNSTETTTTNDTECRPQEAPCLFDVENDPCEFRNLAESHPEEVLHLQKEMMKYFSAKPNNQPADNRSDPANWGGDWVPWQDYVAPEMTQIF